MFEERRAVGFGTPDGDPEGHERGRGGGGAGAAWRHTWTVLVERSEHKPPS